MWEGSQKWCHRLQSLNKRLGHGTCWNPVFTSAFDVAGLPGLECTSAITDGCAHGRLDRGRASSGKLDSDVYDGRSSLRCAMVPNVLARWYFGEADGRQRLDYLDCAVLDGAVGSSPNDAFGRACFRRGDLRR